MAGNTHVVTIHYSRHTHTHTQSKGVIHAATPLQVLSQSYTFCLKHEKLKVLH